MPMLIASLMRPFSISGWHWALWSLAVFAAAGALFHVVLYKRDPRSAAYWVAIIVLVPILGGLLYVVLGINVIRRRGRRYRDTSEKHSTRLDGGVGVAPSQSDSIESTGLGLEATLNGICRLGFTDGNQIAIYRNGDEAMEPMLEAIRSARFSVSLATYIFEAGGVGAEFVRALGDAVQRGVEVRVIVDDAGTRYSWPPVTRMLSQCGVSVHRFMPMRHILRLATMNLRNHRKILIADGKLGFTGGLNIRGGNMVSRNPVNPIRDLHFQVEGPVVGQMQEVFAEDWSFCAGETLEGEKWFPTVTSPGDVSAIGIPDGPDEDIEVMPVAFFAALSAAKKNVKILNPYFLPLPALIWAIKLCVMRGVSVTIVTPAKSNIPLVAWAARTLFPELLDGGCRIFESPPPFDHSKIFIIDDLWSFIGSTNWDPRSLRLNFEFNMACRGADLAKRLNKEFQHKLAESREVTLADIDADSLGVRLRNGIARLFIPLL